MREMSKMRKPRTLRKVAKATILYSLMGLCKSLLYCDKMWHWDLFDWPYVPPNAPIQYKLNNKIASLVLNMIT